jgi:DNA-binding response OmpR family regulator
MLCGELRTCQAAAARRFLLSMESSSAGVLPPRVVIVMDDQWPRALVRAALLEAGYDAVGAPGLEEALAYPAGTTDRGPVRLVVVDQRVLRRGDGSLLKGLLNRHGDPPVLLLSSTTEPQPEGPWRMVIRRPTSVGDLVAAIRDLLPLSSSASGSID